MAPQGHPGVDDARPCVRHRAAAEDRAYSVVSARIQACALIPSTSAGMRRSGTVLGDRGEKQRTPALRKSLWRTPPVSPSPWPQATPRQGQNLSPPSPQREEPRRGAEVETPTSHALSPEPPPKTGRSIYRSL